MTIYIIAGLVAAIALTGIVFVNQKSFGRLPQGARLERIEQSPHYVEGRFCNELKTRQLTSSKGFVRTMWDFLFKEYPNVTPEEPVAAIKTDLKTLPRDSDLIVWFGHSSYLLQLDGKRMLVDPVLVHGSPVRFIGKAFKGADIFKPEDMPAVDYMITTHDHWDHLDYWTQTALRDSIGQVVTPLGVGEHFEYWDFDPARICELDWYEHQAFADGFTFHCFPTRHFSGRGLSRNRTLWGSFVIEAPSGKRVYVGGDGGYSTHFQKIGDRFPGMNLAILENGQYGEGWAEIHTLPEQLGKEMKDLCANHYITVHHSKFALAQHPWDEPFKNELKAAKEAGVRLTVLTIGEVMPIE